MIFLQRLLRDDSGATAIEYGLIAALIAVAAVTVLGTVGGNLTATFQTVERNGRVYLDPRSYARYDPVANVVVSLEPHGTVALYRKLQREIER